MAVSKIPLRDREQNVVAEALISECDRESVEKFRWYRRKEGKTSYAHSEVNGRLMSLHGFLMGPTEKGLVIDHVNHDGLDNRRSNLRVATIRQNNQNSSGRHGTSRYQGVSWNISAGKWRANCCGMYLGSFVLEEDAARAYDRAALALCGPGAQLNGLFTQDEIQRALESPSEYNDVKKAVRNLPSGVYKGKADKTYLGMFDYKGQRKIKVGRFETAEAAKAAVEAKRKELADADLAAHYARLILRNSEGIAIVPVKNKENKVVLEALVDDADWHMLMMTPWHSHKGYVQGKIEGVPCTMHAFLVPGAACVDHINHVKHDNRRSNLRGTDDSHNGQNRSKKEGTTSRYIGVSKRGESWLAQIGKDHKHEYLGAFPTEEGAARAYNKRAMELYDGPQLNDVPAAVEPASEPAVSEGSGKRKRFGTTSQYIGVSKSHKKWAVEILVEGKRVQVGRFKEEDDAARAYNQALDRYGLDKRRNNV